MNDIKADGQSNITTGSNSPINSKNIIKKFNRKSILWVIIIGIIASLIAAAIWDLF